MPRVVGIGHQDFEQMITSDNFYIDKTMFIKEWWENNDTVTLITRPRRFGKTLNLDMTDHFFSVNYFGSNVNNLTQATTTYSVSFNWHGIPCAFLYL